MELYLSGSKQNDEYNQMEEQGILFLLQTFYEMKSWKEEKNKENIELLRYVYARLWGFHLYE